MNIQRAAVIGTGMMGPGIAATLAIGGIPATILSRTGEGSKKGLESARRQLSLLKEHGLAGAWAEVDASSDLDGVVPQVDLVIESAPENMQFKQELFAHLDAISKPEAVLASNTSGLSISEIASKCGRPERILTTHFWNPPHLMPLVEVVNGARTAPGLAGEMCDLLRRCGKQAVLVKRDTPGQLGNRLQMALVREAVHIVEEGIADAESVDLAARSGFGLRLPAYGILEHQDMVGLDLGLSVVDYVSQDLYGDKRAPQLMHDMVREGKLGVKSGQGFYDWSKKDPEAVKARRDGFVLEMMKRRAAAK